MLKRVLKHIEFSTDFQLNLREAFCLACGMAGGAFSHFTGANDVAAFVLAILVTGVALGFTDNP